MLALAPALTDFNYTIANLTSAPTNTVKIPYSLTQIPNATIGTTGVISIHYTGGDGPLYLCSDIKLANSTDIIPTTTKSTPSPTSTDTNSFNKNSNGSERLSVLPVMMILSSAFSILLILALI